MSIEMAGPVAFLSKSNSAVFFSNTKSKNGVFNANPRGTAAPVKLMQSALQVAYWGEDNRFPQNIEQQLAYCGIAKTALDWKARMLWANGIVPVKVTGYKDDGTEIFTPLSRSNTVVYNAINNRSMYRFFLEYLQDWVTYGNCFPEIIFSKDAKSITGFIHQESCDCRFKQMNEQGIIDTLYLSKLWGAANSQYVKFDPKKSMPFLVENPKIVSYIDNKFVKQLDVIDMYNPIESAANLGKNLRNIRGLSGFKSAILPVNYPSVNKTYYQAATWDGARLSGWLEIACKIPSMLKTLYSKAFNIRYQIEIPNSFFEDKFGPEVWDAKTPQEQENEKRAFLKQMDDNLAGDENAYKSFVSFYSYDKTTGTEYGRMTIKLVEESNSLDKEMITQSAADQQLLSAMGVQSILLGAGNIGTGQQRSGGSDKREAFLIYLATLNLERQILLEPLYLMRDFNRLIGGMPEWGEDIHFQFRDTILTTLDTGAGTDKKLS